MKIKKMETEKKSKIRIEKVEKIWTPEVKIHLPGEDGKIVFGYPEPNKYKLDRENFRRPSADQTVDLIYAAFFSEGDKKDLNFILDPSWFKIYNANLWTKEGIYVEECSSDWSDRYPCFNLKVGELEERLCGGVELSNGVRFSNDNKIRFAPKDSYTMDVPTKYSPHKDFQKVWEHSLTHGKFFGGEQSMAGGIYKPEDYVEVRKEELKFCETDIENDGFIIASFGVDGASKLAEIRNRFNGWARCYPISWESESDEYKERVVNDSNYLTIHDLFAGFGFMLIGSSYLYSGWKQMWKNHREENGNDFVKGYKTLYILEE